MTTDTSRAARLAALQAKREARSGGKRRRPAEASRIFVAGAGTAAALTMVASMAYGEQAASAGMAAAVEPVEQTTTVTNVAPQTAPVMAPGPTPTVGASPTVITPVRTVSITRQAPAVAQTHGSR